MCVTWSSKYPCGHTKTRHSPCGKAQAVNFLRCTAKPSFCSTMKKKDELPDLQASCGSMCLTKPYKCNKCDSPQKQLMWRCVDCDALRDNSVAVWAPCQCPKHHCPEAVLEAHFCQKCLGECVPRGPILKWKCHSCKAEVQTYPTEMECAKCLHVRCGKCSALP